MTSACPPGPLPGPAPRISFLWEALVKPRAPWSSPGAKNCQVSRPRISQQAFTSYCREGLQPVHRGMLHRQARPLNPSRWESQQCHLRQLGIRMGFPGGSAGKNAPADAGDEAQSLGQEDPLEEETATHSSILAGESHGQRSLAGYSPQPYCDHPLPWAGLSIRPPGGQSQWPLLGGPRWRPSLGRWGNGRSRCRKTWRPWGLHGASRRR